MVPVFIIHFNNTIGHQVKIKKELRTIERIVRGSFDDNRRYFMDPFLEKESIITRLLQKM